MSADLYFTTDSFFFRPLISELAERNSTKSATWSEISEIWKRMSKIWGIPPLQIGGSKTTFFEDFATSPQLRNEIWYRQSVKRIDNNKGSLTSSQNNTNFGPQTASNWNVIFTHPT